MALNQDKNRLQLRRRSGSPEHSRSFKFTACAVSENLSGTLSPRSSAIVPGRRAGSPVLRGLKVGEIMSVLRDRSPPREGESMAWPHRRGDESLILASAAYPRRSRSASPPPRVRPGPGPDDEARLAAMFAAVSAEEEAEVDILKLGGVNPDGRTRPLSPRVPGSDWQEGLSTRMAERGGSRLFPTHLAKSAPASASRAPAGMKPGGVFVPGGSPKAKAKAPQAPSLAAEAPSRLPKPKAARRSAPPASPSPIEAQDKKPNSKALKKPSSSGGERPGDENAPRGEVPVTADDSRTRTEAKGMSKLHLLRKRLEDTMRKAEEGLETAPKPKADGEG